MTMPTVRRLTGRHVATIFVAFFGVVIAVNVLMARFALSTFGGTVVDNSYVASQNFNGWLADARRQGQLGWSATAERLPDGRVRIRVRDARGDMLAGAQVNAIADHPLGAAARRELTLRRDGDAFVSLESLRAARWRTRVDVVRGHDRAALLVDMQ